MHHIILLWYLLLLFNIYRLYIDYRLSKTACKMNQQFVINNYLKKEIITIVNS